MIIIGCDYHPGFQQIAFLDTDTGEWNERRLAHREEAEQLYRDLGTQGVRALGHGKLSTAQIYTRVSVGRMMQTYMGLGNGVLRSKTGPWANSLERKRIRSPSSQSHLSLQDKRMSLPVKCENLRGSTLSHENARRFWAEGDSRRLRSRRGGTLPGRRSHEAF